MVEAVTEIPPTPRQVVIEHCVVRRVLVIAHRVVTAAQHQLIAQTQRAVPIEGCAPLLFAGAALPIVAAGKPRPPGFLRGVGDQHLTAADVLAGSQFHRGLVRGQTIELIDHLLDFAQVDQVTRFTGKGHRQFAFGQMTVRGAL
ncbi:hypothetical protein D3C87_1270160 [compost metagenome]